MKQYAVLLALAEKLETVLIANGYNTNAGQNVMVSPDELDADALSVPALRLFEQESLPEQRLPNTTQCKVRTTYVVEVVHVVANTANHTQEAHKVVSDVCNALFSGSLVLERLPIQLAYEGHRILARQSGSKSVVVQVRGSHVTAEVFAIPN